MNLLLSSLLVLVLLKEINKANKVIVIITDVCGIENTLPSVLCLTDWLVFQDQHPLWNVHNSLRWQQCSPPVIQGDNPCHNYLSQNGWKCKLRAPHEKGWQLASPCAVVFQVKWGKQAAQWKPGQRKCSGGSLVTGHCWLVHHSWRLKRLFLHDGLECQMGRRAQKDCLRCGIWLPEQRPLMKVKERGGGTTGVGQL